ncbi:MAG: hypothetical protein RIQ60_132 [Pseudomonadota bacterium]
MQTEICTSVLRVNDAPALPYELSVNPYRGCAHSCVFCPTAPQPAAQRAIVAQLAASTPSIDSARRTADTVVSRIELEHALATGAATPAVPEPSGAVATTCITVHAKRNVADRLRQELRRPGYRPRPLCLGAAADVYQPAERQQRLTRAVLAVLVEAAHPVGLTTRSVGVVRDVDLLVALSARGLALVLISLASSDPWLSEHLEPGASAPAQRLAALRSLARAGVWAGLQLAPLVPGVNDGEQVETLIAMAAQAGARCVRWQAATPSPGGAACGDAAWRASLDQRIRSAAGQAGLSCELPALDCSQFHPPQGPDEHRDRPPAQKLLF